MDLDPDVARLGRREAHHHIPWRAECVTHHHSEVEWALRRRLKVGAEVQPGNPPTVRRRQLCRPVHLPMKGAPSPAEKPEERITTSEPKIVTACVLIIVNEVRRAFDYVFTTGGIGPTHDDITAQCVADAFGLALIVHPEAKRLLETHYPPRHLNEARLRMAMVPEGATLLPNPISRAPGFQIGNVFVLPGVPSIMQGIFEQLKHRLVGGEKVRSGSVSCRLAEGTLAKDLGALQARYPELEIGSYPYFRRGDFGVTLVLRGTDSVRLADATRELTELIRALGGDPQEGLSES